MNICFVHFKGFVYSSFFEQNIKFPARLAFSDGKSFVHSFRVFGLSRQPTQNAFMQK